MTIWRWVITLRRGSSPALLVQRVSETRGGLLANPRYGCNSGSLCVSSSQVLMWWLTQDRWLKLLPFQDHSFPVIKMRCSIVTEHIMSCIYILNHPNNLGEVTSCSQGHHSKYKWTKYVKDINNQYAYVLHIYIDDFRPKVAASAPLCSFIKLFIHLAKQCIVARWLISPEGDATDQSALLLLLHLSVNLLLCPFFEQLQSHQASEFICAF